MKHDNIVKIIRKYFKKQFGIDINKYTFSIKKCGIINNLSDDKKQFGKYVSPLSDKKIKKVEGIFESLASNHLKTNNLIYKLIDNVIYAMFYITRSYGVRTIMIHPLIWSEIEEIFNDEYDTRDMFYTYLKKYFKIKTSSTKFQHFYSFADSNKWNERVEVVQNQITDIVRIGRLDNINIILN